MSERTPKRTSVRTSERTPERPRGRPYGRSDGRPNGHPHGRPHRRPPGCAHGRPNGRPNGRLVGVHTFKRASVRQVTTHKASGAPPQDACLSCSQRMCKRTNKTPKAAWKPPYRRGFPGSRQRDCQSLNDHILYDFSMAFGKSSHDKAAFRRLSVFCWFVCTCPRYTASMRLWAARLKLRGLSLGAQGRA